MCNFKHFVEAYLFRLIPRASASPLEPIHIRVSIIVYRNEGDDYIVRVSAFTSIDAALAFIEKQQCGGDGEFSKAMGQALEAAEQLDWRRGNVARILFLVSDSPPQDTDFQRTFNAAIGLRRQGVRVYGIGEAHKKAEYILRLMAIITGARYSWIIDDIAGAGYKDAKRYDCYRVTFLYDLLERLRLGELLGHRVEAKSSTFEVGRQKDGICVVTPPTTTTPTTSSTETKTSLTQTSKADSKFINAGGIICSLLIHSIVFTFIWHVI